MQQQKPGHAGAVNHGEWDVRGLDYVAALYRHRRVLLTVFLLVVTAMMVQAFTSKPVYRGAARLLLDEEQATVAGFGQGEAGSSDSTLFYQTQYRVLRGRALARRVVHTLNLTEVPAFNGTAVRSSGLGGAIDAIRLRVVDPLLSYVESAEAAGDDPPEADEDPVESLVIDAFLERVEVEPVRNSRLVDISVQGPTAALAAQLTNTLADEYVAQNLESKTEANRRTLEWLAGELEEQQRKLRDSEGSLANYRDSENALSLGERQNIVVSRLNQLNEAVTRAKTTRIQRETLYNQIKNLSDTDVAAAPAILGNGFIQQQKSQLAELQREHVKLSERYGDKHPEIAKVKMALADTRRRIAEETAKVVDAIKNEYLSALTEERTLAAALEQQKTEAVDLDRKNVDYTVLEREAQMNRQVYETLLQREKELRVASNSRTNNIRVVDRAEVPTKPFAPDLQRTLLISIVLGFGLGLAAAFGLDYVDDTIKTPEEVTRKLRLPFLGLVPAVAGETAPSLASHVPNDFSESFRALRTSLVFSSSAPGTRVIAVTSTQPLEGKTTTACNLALALSFSGSRVLLIDADMRRPGLHGVLDLSNDAGLSNLLVGQARARDAIQKTKHPNLWALTGGLMPPNPSELLSSEQMRSLLSSLTTSGPFDWVIIDTPPVLAVTDAVILMPEVSGVVLVLRAEATRRRLVQQAIDTLSCSNPRILGVVLNRVDLKRNSFYYSRYYGYQYKSYYSRAAAAA